MAENDKPTVRFGGFFLGLMFFGAFAVSAELAMISIRLSEIAAQAHCTIEEERP